MGYIEEMRKLVGNRPLILVGSHVIILNNNNEVLLQLRSDYNCWGIIGGALECGETLEEAAKREVYEETGLTVKYLEPFQTFSGKEFFNIYPNGDQVHGVLVTYICRDFEGTLRIDHAESKDFRFFPIYDLPTNIGLVHKLVLDTFIKSNLD
ncbi:TPA: NUDIX hydrolase [Bacillus pseudomycoides]|nr:NUDIX hydrolase [Bacillus pseudomycoides]